MARWSSRTLLFVSVVGLSAAAQCEIVYKVTLAPSEEKALLEIEVPVREKAAEISFQIPRWGPGSYSYRDNASRLSEITARTTSGKTLEVRKVDATTWAVPTGGESSVKLSYRFPVSNDNGGRHWSGPASYMYVLGRLNEDCRLVLEMPSDWKVAVGLNPMGSNNRIYKASDYDVLADNPVTVGDFVEDRYIIRGKPHFIAVRGTFKGEADMQAVRKACEAITLAQANFFRGLPYDRYVWHFVASDQRDGGWGLEHLSSTQIGLSTGLGYRSVGVLSHEFFHLWNVKRIRSKVLGPFNYQELPQTGALWFLEGGTDYYAHLLLRRYGWSTDPQFFENVSRNVRTTRANNRRFEVSPHEASFRVRDANNGQGNSTGFAVNYYNTGYLASLCLDIELREKTENRHSLDDVVRKLYEQTKDNRPGFEEDEIRRQLVSFGGLSLGYFYDQIVMKPGELPVEAQLAKVGLKLYERDTPLTDLGFSWSANRERKGLVVRDVKGVAEGKLQNGDIVVNVNGAEPQGTTARWLQEFGDEVLAKLAPGKEAVLLVMREGSSVPLKVQMTPGATTRKEWAVEEDTNASKDAIEFRKKWFAAPRGWKPIRP